MTDTLNNKPLIEAILEVKWGLVSEDGGIQRDPRAQLFIGQLFEQIKDRFPYKVELAASRVPENMTAYTPRMQFRVGDEEWPLVQIGPGILTVNQTEEYEWGEYLSLCSAIVGTLFEIYPEEGVDLDIIEVSLRYIDADQLNGPVIDLIRELKIDVPKPSFFEEIESVDDDLLAINMSMTYPCHKPKGALLLSYNQGTKNGERALIWETRLFSRAADAPKNHGDFIGWMEGAHAVTHDWFMHQISGNLLAKYK